MSERLSVMQLCQRQAQGNYHFGEHYRHNESGHVYEIVGASIRESDCEIVLQYEQIVGPLANCPFGRDIRFDRPLDEFVEPRFTKVEQKVIYE